MSSAPRSLLENIEHLTTQWKKDVVAVTTLADLEALRLSFIGKKGHITQLLKSLGTASLEEKRAAGPRINLLKKQCELDVQEHKERIIRAREERDIAQKSNFDVSAYTPHLHHGGKHPYSFIIEEIENIFISMGFSLFNGPEVEDDYYNFTALNIPDDHPARDMYDTFWLNKENHLLRTHTSTVQMRVMKQAVQNGTLPLAGICSGRVYRHEAVDASHDYMFMQCEGILIDKNITLAHLFGVTKEFIARLFNTDRLTIRTRPGFFPFVEPGVEIDMQCPFCKNGCATCKKSGWIEVFPGGLIHPNVLREAGIDPEVYSGFAFGFGLTRIAMLKYGIHDIRALHSGKVDFLKQFNNNT